MSVCNLEKLESGEARKRQVHHTFLPVVNIQSKLYINPSEVLTYLDSACSSFFVESLSQQAKKTHCICRMPILLKSGIRGVLFVHGGEQQLEKYHFQNFRLTLITCWWPGGMIAQRSIRTCVLQILMYILSFE